MLTMIYKKGGRKKIWGIECEAKTVLTDDLPKYLKEGWFKSPLDFDKEEKKAPKKSAKKAVKDE